MNNMNAENNEQPLVSIAIALYNKEDSIYRTLQSIQNQTYKNFECIIVDDHSTDNGPNIVYQCFCKNDKRFKLTICFSPTLTTMCLDGPLQERFVDYLKSRIELGEKEVVRCKKE